MESKHMLSILQQVKDGSLDIHDAYGKLKISPFEDLGYAKIDHHRKIRQGAPEVIYGAGKTAEQMEGILHSLLSHCPENILITRLSEESAVFIIRGNLVNQLTAHNLHNPVGCSLYDLMITRRENQYTRKLYHPGI